MKIMVTGGAGFIGCNLVRHLLRRTSHSVVNVDKLTYAGNLDSLADVRTDSRHALVQADVADAAAMRNAFQRHQPDAVMHLAAESHNDRAIEAPMEFVRSNVLGTAVMRKEG